MSSKCRLRLLIGLVVVSYGLSISYAQDRTIHLRGYFQVDSTYIGLPTPFVVVVRYPLDYEVFLPDSTHNFSPFEWNKKVCFSSKLEKGQVYDSIVYYVSPFALDSVQALQLSMGYKEIRSRDTLRLWTQKDSVYIAKLVQEAGPLKAHVKYMPAVFQLNYARLWKIVGVSVSVLFVLFLIFRKKIVRQWKLYYLARNYKRFIKAFYLQLDHLRIQPHREGAHSMLHLWKTYLETLEKKPYSKLTTSEICDIENNRSLQKPLQALDRAMYGHTFSKEDLRWIEELIEIAQNRYAVKKQKVV